MLHAANSCRAMLLRQCAVLTVAPPYLAVQAAQVWDLVQRHARANHELGGGDVDVGDPLGHRVLHLCIFSHIWQSVMRKSCRTTRLPALSPVKATAPVVNPRNAASERPISLVARSTAVHCAPGCRWGTL